MVTYLVVGQVIMDAYVGPWIYRLVTDNHARECIVRRQPLHAYVWRWCVHACLNTQHWCGACVKNRTLPTQSKIGSWCVVVLATSTRWEGFMRTHACVCAQIVSCMSFQSMTYIYTVLQGKNNPLLSQINLSCVVKQKVVMDQAGP